MNIEEIHARLEAEGITDKHFTRKLFPDDSRQHQGAKLLPWLGKVEIIDFEHNDQTKRELENERTVYHLPEHGLYLRTTGTKEKRDGDEKKKWYYWEFLRPCKPVTEELGSRTIYI